MRTIQQLQTTHQESQTQHLEECKSYEHQLKEQFDRHQEELREQATMHESLGQERTAAHQELLDAHKIEEEKWKLRLSEIESQLSTAVGKSCVRAWPLAA